jgi:hypothetical protein
MADCICLRPRAEMVRHEELAFVLEMMIAIEMPARLMARAPYLARSVRRPSRDREWYRW